MGSYPSMKNRVLISKVTKKTKNKVSREKGSKKNSIVQERGRVSSFSNMSFNSPRISFLNSKRLIGNLANKIKGTDYYLFMISEKQITNRDQVHYEDDDEVLDNKILPEWLHFNTIYLFSYKGKGDVSRFEKQIETESIQIFLFDKIEKSGDKSEGVKRARVYVELEGEKKKQYEFIFSTAYEANAWYHGLRMAKKYEFEKKTSLTGRFKVNVNSWMRDYERGVVLKPFSLIDSYVGELDQDDLTVDHFLKRNKKIISEIHSCCDTILAFRPFNSKFYEIVVRRINVKMRNVFLKKWNMHYKTMEMGEILTFGQQMNWYLDVMNINGIVDRKLEKCLEPVVATFCWKMVDSSQYVMFKIICDSLHDYKKEKDRFINPAVKNLESHIIILFDHYNKFPSLNTAKLMVSTISEIISQIQISFIWELESKIKHVSGDYLSELENPDNVGEKKRFTKATKIAEMENETLLSLLNSPISPVIRNFIKKVHNVGNGKITLKMIRFWLNYQYLLRNDFQMIEILLQRFEGNIDSELRVLFDSISPDFLDMNMKSVLSQFQEKLSYEDLYSGFVNSDQKLRVVTRVCDQVLRFYFSKFFEFCGCFCPSDFELVLAKLKMDHGQISSYFQLQIEDCLDARIGLILDLYTFMETEELFTIETTMLKIMAFFGSDFVSFSNVQQLLSCKFLFPNGVIMDIENQYREWLYQTRKRAAVGLQNSILIDSRHPLLRKFVVQLKIRQRARNLRLKILRRASNFEENLMNVYRTNGEVLKYKSNTQALLQNSVIMEDIFAFQDIVNVITFSSQIAEDFIPKYIKEQIKLK